MVDARNRLLVCTGDGLLIAQDADAPASTLHLGIWAVADGGVDHQAAKGRFERVIATATAAGMAIEFGRDDEIWLATGDSGVLRYRIRGQSIDKLEPLGPPNLASRDIAFMHRDRHARM